MASTKKDSLNPIDLMSSFSARTKALLVTSVLALTPGCSYITPEGQQLLNGAIPAVIVLGVFGGITVLAVALTNRISR